MGIVATRKDVKVIKNSLDFILGLRQEMDYCSCMTDEDKTRMANIFNGLQWLCSQVDPMYVLREFPFSGVYFHKRGNESWDVKFPFEADEYSVFEESVAAVERVWRKHEEDLALKFLYGELDVVLTNVLINGEDRPLKHAGFKLESYRELRDDADSDPWSK